MQFGAIINYIKGRLSHYIYTSSRKSQDGLEEGSESSVVV